MARDRLAAMRAQQGGQREQSYPTQPENYGDGGRGYTGGYEMSNVHGGAGDMSAFYSEISDIQESIRTFNDNVARISDMHSRSLNNMDDIAAQRNAAQLDELVQDTSALSGELKSRIKNLERQALQAQRGGGREAQIRTQQTGLVKSKFVEAIQAYQDVEKNYRTKYKARMERQFKIVKPDASPEEVRAVVNDEGGGQIFAQALMNSNEYGQSKAAYKEVQERHQDIKQIEKTITELAQLFQDMAVLVEQQDETLNVIEAHAEAVDQDMEQGLKHTEAAVDSARSARKKRWICFIIILIILIIVGVVVGVVVSNNVKKTA